MPDRGVAPAVPVADLAGDALALRDLDEKVAAVVALRARWDAARGAGRDAGAGDPTGSVARFATVDPPARLRDVTDPGRPLRPHLVAPRELRARRLTTAAGRVAGVHAVAHIEANAMNLALDAIHRFAAGLPLAYVDDWVAVACDEARHFLMLRARLADFGAEYGDLPAHDGLWAAAVRTADDPLRRMALVPRVLEARGLDVSPGMIERFEAAGDPETAAVLRVILAEEVAHVAVGSQWFRWLCAERGLDPEPTFRRLLDEAGVAVVPPFNLPARRAAGFGPQELEALVGR